MTQLPCDPLPDLDIPCPHCDYNLTGLPEPRCPECGHSFDPVDLQRRARRLVLPSCPWDSQGGLRGYIRTALLVALHPHRFASNFPRHHSTDHAQAYTLTTFFIAVPGGALAAIRLVTHDAKSRAQSLEAVLLLLVSSMFFTLALTLLTWVCQSLTALSITCVIHPIHDYNRYHFWRGLIHYSNAFVFFAVAWVASLFIEHSITGTLSYDPLVRGLRAAAALAPFLWWSISLAIMIAAAARPGPRRTLACLTPPIFTLANLLTLLQLTHQLHAVMQLLGLR